MMKANEISEQNKVEIDLDTQEGRQQWRKVDIISSQATGDYKISKLTINLEEVNFEHKSHVMCTYAAISDTPDLLSESAKVVRFNTKEQNKVTFEWASQTKTGASSSIYVLYPLDRNYIAQFSMSHKSHGEFEPEK